MDKNLDFKTPKVTVLMPVYNGEKYLGEAIESILNQTFTDFELLIINDGSTDKSVEIIHSYSNSRIRLEHNSENTGLIATLNRGMSLAAGRYIARMDCDDISMPSRLKKQVQFLEKHPDVGICGTWIRQKSDRGLKLIPLPVDPEHIRCGLLFYSTLAHPTVMIRKEYLLKYNLFFDPEYQHAEDYELWERATHCFSLANIPEFLLDYRMHTDQVGEKYQSEQWKNSQKIWQRQLEALGLNAVQKDLEIHQAICTLRMEPSVLFMERVEYWLETLLSANRATGVYPQKIMNEFVADRLMQCCHKVYGISLDALRTFKRAHLLTSREKITQIFRHFIAKVRYRPPAAGVN